MTQADIVRASIRTCTRCPLHAAGNGPVPWRGPVPARIAIVGEAPGRMEDKVGAPFIGPAGDLLTNMLVRVGIDPNGVFVCNTVSCYPADIRTPQDEHIDACARNLVVQLALSQAEHVLLLGSVALNRWRPGSSITRERGNWWTEEELPHHPVMFPTFHPAYVLRNRTKTKAWRTDIEQFEALTHA